LGLLPIFSPRHGSKQVIWLAAVNGRYRFVADKERRTPPTSSDRTGLRLRVTLAAFGFDSELGSFADELQHFIAMRIERPRALPAQMAIEAIGPDLRVR
jgi:hypothetical protein